MAGVPAQIAFVSGWLVFAGLSTFLTFGVDKRQAETGGWRIPENTLLWLAFLGGWCGAKLGQRYFRHKTWKEPFRTRLNRIGLYWLTGAVLWAVPGAWWQALVGWIKSAASGV